MPKMTTAQLIPQLKKAKQRPMYFQFAGGKTEKDHYFVVSHKKLPPRGLQEAKKAAGNRPMGGTVKVDGKEVIFETVDNCPTTKYQLLLKTYLRTLKMGGMTVVIRPPGGGEEDDKKK